MAFYHENDAEEATEVELAQSLTLEAMFNEVNRRITENDNDLKSSRKYATKLEGNIRILKEELEDHKKTIRFLKGQNPEGEPREG